MLRSKVPFEPIEYRDENRRFTTLPRRCLALCAGHQLNIESVVVDHIATGDHARIYGRICVDNGCFFGYPFQLSDIQSEKVGVGGSLTLTGPNARLLGNLHSTIKVDLYDADHEGSFAAGVLNFQMGTGNHTRNLINRRLSYQFKGPLGAVTVNYTTLNYAVPVMFKFIISGEEAQNLRFFGTITHSQYLTDTDTTFQFQLFLHNVADSVALAGDCVLPLQRELVAVPIAERAPAASSSSSSSSSSGQNLCLAQVGFQFDLWAINHNDGDDCTFPVATEFLPFDLYPLDENAATREKMITGNHGLQVLVSMTCRA